MAAPFSLLVDNGKNYNTYGKLITTIAIGVTTCTGSVKIDWHAKNYPLLQIRAGGRS
jgi:hypothetical protein